MLFRYSTLNSAVITQLIAPVITKAITIMNIFSTPCDRSYYLIRIYHIFTVSNLRGCEHFVNKRLLPLEVKFIYDIIFYFSSLSL
jgi:hypothetical protein